MPISTKPFDAAKYFLDANSQARLLADALEEGDAGYIAAALGVVAKARGITQIANETGLSRQALHKALSENGNPTLDTVIKVIRALDLQLDVKAKMPVVV
jgi:probable addiction module antidote protein